ncbi:hypothetical protein CF327_g2998 [Tilletia walkeri]|uniref:Uncharacterized protein n=1 Tax=Tilletia walkeri TaxID=117179 RepID=A0A8X7NDL2_9BASI|nr:hypothetical protein CF327_g2998 [Tilletia walkeri]KAE8271118.1 hypothetical protein A4X09_0g1210 [Tilletia walkeri]
MAQDATLIIKSVGSPGHSPSIKTLHGRPRSSTKVVASRFVFDPANWEDPVPLPHHRRLQTGSSGQGNPGAGPAHGLLPPPLLLPYAQGSPDHSVHPSLNLHVANSKAEHNRLASTGSTTSLKRYCDSEDGDKKWCVLKRIPWFDAVGASFAWVPGGKGASWPRASAEAVSDAATTAVKAPSASPTAEGSKSTRRHATVVAVPMFPVLPDCENPVGAKPAQGFGWLGNGRGTTWPRSLLSSLGLRGGQKAEKCYWGKGQITQVGAVAAVSDAALEVTSTPAPLSSPLTARRINKVDIGADLQHGAFLDPKSTHHGIISTFPWSSNSGDGATWPRRTMRASKETARKDVASDLSFPLLA